MIKGQEQRTGFSLVELLIAFFVLLVGILAVLVLFPLGLQESKTMVDASTAAFAARTARGLMEVQPFVYAGNKQGNGTASMVQIIYGPRGSKGNIYKGTFPVMFPADVLGAHDDATFPLTQRPLDPNTNSRDRVVDRSNSQFSWDARFTIGGGLGLTLPPGGFTWADLEYWWTQYFKYYAVQISVYRNYEEISIGPGTLWVKAAEKPGGGHYDVDDPNRPFYSELEIAQEPDADLTVGSYIRVRDDKSDWYQITAQRYTDSPRRWYFRLDRPYDRLVGLIGNMLEISAGRNDLIGTNTLVESFTTILGSQLEETDTSGLDAGSIKW
ncbi:MAG: hypothetical protein AMK75_00745 [Planctomycetes bacterium SM23_65]|nr:MAG: hypothetical protein AMK75_00745 [Planctomycetes bacterium SM23_65]